jgi:hypothetical protein
MARPAGLGGRFRWPPVQNVLLVIHGLGWLVAMGFVTASTASHVPPSELWMALPLGISAILVAFRAGDGTEHRRPPPPHREEQG